jgi:pyridoxal phosphate enzyme (YggS family)
MAGAAQRLTEVRARIAKAATLAGRKSQDITLIAVTKGRSMAEIEPLIEAGQRDFGESRVQEALAKWPAALAKHGDLRLHAIGRLQSNKAEEAARLFDVIHSLDRPSLLQALAAAADKQGRAPSVYVQVNIGDELQKGGCPIAQTGELIAAVRASPLPLAGLMAIPPLGLEPSPFFALLAEIAHRQDVAGLSMGMSSDYEEAVMLGATAARVGSRLFDD